MFTLFKSISVRTLTATTALCALAMPTLALDLTVSEGKLIQLPGKAKTVFVANPLIASYQAPTADKLFVFGNIAGQTNLYVLDAKGKVIFDEQIKVQHNVDALNEQIATLYPESRVEAISNRGELILKGSVPSPDMANQVVELARSYMRPLPTQTTSASSGGSNAGAQSASDEDLEPVNQLTVTLPNQVNIRVRIAEVSRNVTTKLGLRPGDDFIGFDASQPAIWSHAGNEVASLDLTTAIDKVLGVDIGSHSILLDALAREGAAKLLAEPNLTALSGEKASFLAGGEFPVPVSQTLTGQVLLDYKQFGVLLNITPTVLSDQRISLKIQPEVSSLDNNSGFRFNGLTVPAVSVRRTETTIELASGDSFMLGGLLMSDENNNVSKYPFLGDIPVLGALFRSTGFERKETELVIIAEAYVVKPSREDQLTLPTDNFTPYSDLERLLNLSWREETTLPPLRINDDQPRLLGDNGFYY